MLARRRNLQQKEKLTTSKDVQRRNRIAAWMLKKGYLQSLPPDITQIVIDEGTEMTWEEKVSHIYGNKIDFDEMFDVHGIMPDIGNHMFVREIAEHIADWIESYYATYNSFESAQPAQMRSRGFYLTFQDNYDGIDIMISWCLSGLKYFFDNRKTFDDSINVQTDSYCASLFLERDIYPNVRHALVSAAVKVNEVFYVSLFLTYDREDNTGKLFLHQGQVSDLPTGMCDTLVFPILQWSNYMSEDYPNPQGFPDGIAEKISTNQQLSQHIHLKSQGTLEKPSQMQAKKPTNNTQHLIFM